MLCTKYMQRIMTGEANSQGKLRFIKYSSQVKAIITLKDRDRLKDFSVCALVLLKSGEKISR